jgi:hypothetical protein
MLMTRQTEVFEDTDLEVISFGGERWLRGPQIAGALGFKNPSKAISDIYSRNRSEFDDTTTLVIEMPTNSGRQLVRLYNARGAALIAMKANTPKGEAFRRWVLDVLEGKADADVPIRSGEMTAGVLYSLREMFLQRKGNTQLVRYRQMGLGTAEIARLLDCKPRSINPRLRVSEFLGLTAPPADLALHQSKATFQKMMEGKKRWQAAHRARQAALPAPGTEDEHHG